MDETKNEAAAVGCTCHRQTVTLHNPTDAARVMSGAIVGPVCPKCDAIREPRETSRGRCFRTAGILQNDAVRVAQFALKLEQCDASASVADLVDSYADKDELGESLTKAIGALLEHAEHWRANARRCAR